MTAIPTEKSIITKSPTDNPKEMSIFLRQMEPRIERKFAYPPTPYTPFYHEKETPDLAYGTNETCMPRRNLANFCSPYLNFTLSDTQTGTLTKYLSDVKACNRPVLGIHKVAGFDYPSPFVTHFNKTEHCSHYTEKYCNRSIYRCCKDGFLKPAELEDQYSRNISTAMEAEKVAYNNYMPAKCRCPKCGRYPFLPEYKRYTPTSHKKADFYDMFVGGPKNKNKFDVRQRAIIPEKCLPISMLLNGRFLAPDDKGPNHADDTSYGIEFRDPKTKEYGYKGPPKHRIDFRTELDLNDGHRFDYMAHKLPKPPRKFPFFKYSPFTSDEYYLNKMKNELCIPAVPSWYRPCPIEIECNLFWGDGIAARDANMLKKAGITHVLDCGGSRAGNPYPLGSGVVSYLCFPAIDAEDYDMMQHFDPAVQFIDAARKSGGKVLVFSQRGLNRSGFIMAAYLMAREGHTLPKALTELRNARKAVLFNSAFQKQLLQLARKKNLTL